MFWLQQQEGGGAQKISINHTRQCLINQKNKKKRIYSVDSHTRWRRNEADVWMAQHAPSHRRHSTVEVSVPMTNEKKYFRIKNM